MKGRHNSFWRCYYACKEIYTLNWRKKQKREEKKSEKIAPRFCYIIIFTTVHTLLRSPRMPFIRAFFTSLSLHSSNQYARLWEPSNSFDFSWMLIPWENTISSKILLVQCRPRNAKKREILHMFHYSHRLTPEPFDIMMKDGRSREASLGPLWVPNQAERNHVNCQIAWVTAMRFYLFAFFHVCNFS